MSNTGDDFSFLDDERFDVLIDGVETLLRTFFELVLVDEDVEVSPEETDADVDEITGYFSVALAAFRAEILSLSENSEGDQTFELKMTIPSRNLRNTVQRIIEEIGSDDSD